MTLLDIADLTAIQLGRREAPPDADLFADLGAESMDLMNLAIAIEDRFDVFIPEESLARVRTIRELHEVAQTCRDEAG